MSHGAAWGILAGFCLVSVALATPDAAGAPAVRKRPFPEYRVNLGARDPFSSASGGSAVSAMPEEGTGGDLKAVPGSVNGGVTVDMLAEGVLLQSVASGTTGPDMATINGVVRKVGAIFAFNVGGTQVELTLVEVTRNPPEARLRWGTQEFVKSLKPRGER